MSVEFVAMCPACIYVLSSYIVLFLFLYIVCALLCVLYMYLVALVSKTAYSEYLEDKQ